MKLYIDPSVDRQACAYLSQRGELEHVGFATLADFRGRPWSALTCVMIEKMQVYGRSDGDPNDLIDVHGAASRVAEAIEIGGGPQALWPRPREWKQQVKKWIHHRRIWEMLTEPERVCFGLCVGKTQEVIWKKIDDACKRWARGEVTKNGKVKGYDWAEHNLFDAVGLGLWHHGRIGIGGRLFGTPLGCKV